MFTRALRGNNNIYMYTLRVLSTFNYGVNFLASRSTAVTVLPTKNFSSDSAKSSQSTSISNSCFPDNDHPDLYKKVRKVLDAELERRLNNPNRFQSINDREDRSDVPLDAFKINSKGRYIVKYKGCNIVSSPEDYVLYHQLFWYIKPKTVIEVGTCEGGSALWLGDQLKLLGITDGHVYTMELDPSLPEGAKKLNPDNITFLQGDSNEIEKTFTPEMLSKLPHPWVVIEDSHVNVSGIYSGSLSSLPERRRLFCGGRHQSLPSS